jgi:pyrrolidone-carboxylate peptidase
MILVTCFEPFGIIGRLLNRNISIKIADALLQKYPSEIVILKLPVDNRCRHLIRDYNTTHKPEFMFMLGEGDNEIRIETMTNSGKVSEFALNVKNSIGFDVKNKIGAYWCNKAYSCALKVSENKKVIFVHLPKFQTDIKKVIEIFVEAKKLAEAQ